MSGNNSNLGILRLITTPTSTDSTDGVIVLNPYLATITANGAETAPTQFAALEGNPGGDPRVHLSAPGTSGDAFISFDGTTMDVILAGTATPAISITGSTTTVQNLSVAQIVSNDATAGTEPVDDPGTDFYQRVVQNNITTIIGPDSVIFDFFTSPNTSYTVSLMAVVRQTGGDSGARQAWYLIRQDAAGTNPTATVLTTATLSAADGIGTVPDFVIALDPNVVHFAANVVGLWTVNIESVRSMVV